MQVDPVEKGTREPAEIVLALSGCAGAAVDRTAGAAAGVGGGDQLEVGREVGAACCPRHHDLALLQRLAQRLQGAPGEFRQLVQEQDAQMGEAHLARMRQAAAADEGGMGHGVMGRAERARGHEAGRESDRRPGHAPHGGDLDRFLERRRGQDGRQAAGQHGLAGAGRAEHQDVVRARRGDLEGPLGVRLPAHLAEVDLAAALGIRRQRRRRRRDQRALAVEVLDGLPQRDDGDHVDARHAPRSPRHWPWARRGARCPPAGSAAPSAAHPEPVRTLPSSESSPTIIEPSSNAGLITSVVTRMPTAMGRSKAGPSLRMSAGARLDRDPLDRELEAGVVDGGADAVAALAHAGVGEPHRGEAGQPVDHVHLDPDARGVDAVQTGGTDTREHGPSVGAGPRAVNVSN